VRRGSPRAWRGAGEEARLPGDGVTARRVRGRSLLQQAAAIIVRGRPRAGGGWPASPPAAGERPPGAASLLPLHRALCSFVLRELVLDQAVARGLLSRASLPSVSLGRLCGASLLDRHRAGVPRGPALAAADLAAVRELLAQAVRELVPTPAEEPLPLAALGGVHEELLGLSLLPDAPDAPDAPGPAELQVVVAARQRKGSGSFFTPPELVAAIVRRALGPLLAECGADASRLLGLRVLDPALGAGAFLLEVLAQLGAALDARCSPPRHARHPRLPTSWRSLVAESCLYGVDRDPLAVALARASLWLAAAAPEQALPALGRHLRVGDALVGAPVLRLGQPALRAVDGSQGPRWVAAAPSPVGRGQPAALSTAAPALAGGEPHVRRLLADLWCLQWFCGAPTPATVHAYQHPEGLYASLQGLGDLPDPAARRAALRRLSSHSLVRKVRQIRTAPPGTATGPFLHWPLAFPALARDLPDSGPGAGGFDLVVGNPPWERLRPERRHFYATGGRSGPAGAWDLAGAQGASLDGLIEQMHELSPGLAAEFQKYQQHLAALTRFFRQSGVYGHQAAPRGGRPAGGDPDLYQLFVERAFQLVRPGGRVALLTPGVLWQAAGCTGLRRLLLQEKTTEELHVFANDRSWAFPIDSRFKLSLFVAVDRTPPPGHEVLLGTGRRQLLASDEAAGGARLRLGLAQLAQLSPATLALPDLPDSALAGLLLRLHACHPLLGQPESGWELSFRREVDMTVDAWRFQSREWLAQRGCLQVLSLPAATGGGQQRRQGAASGARYPATLPAGGEFWVAADEAWYRARGYLEEEELVEGHRRRVFVHPADAEAASPRGAAAGRAGRLLPGALYVPLYEGRMLHNFDHAQKAYLGGDGPRARWRALGLTEKRLVPRRFVGAAEVAVAPIRLLYGAVANGTNERTLLAALVGPHAVAGNSCPRLAFSSWPAAACAAAVLNSLIFDGILRRRVASNVNLVHLRGVPVPCLGDPAAPPWRPLVELVAVLSCTTPELAPAWEAVFPGVRWSFARAERDPWRRGALRAELDARVAACYGLTLAEYARLLADFPLLDRDQPALPGDLLVTETGGRRPRGLAGQDWEHTPDGPVELRPRSFITRDLALLTACRLRGEPPPADLEAFYREQVGLDPRQPGVRFRIGPVRDLEERVALARGRGAVAYQPAAGRTRPG